MHGEPPGAASAFLSVASRVEVDDFFRYLGEWSNHPQDWTLVVERERERVLVEVLRYTRGFATRGLSLRLIG